MPNRPIALLAMLVLGAASLTACSDDGGKSIEEEVEGVAIIRIDDRSHDTGPVDYDRQPPAGGAHNPVWVNCGFYEEVIPSEYAVHALEHGAVWIAYQPDLPADDVSAIHDIARANDRVLATPFEGLDSAVVLTAWSRQLPLDDLDDPRLEQFITTYSDANTAPEAGGSCSGAAGEPIS